MSLFGRNWLTGIICMWSGLLVDIPNGWALCDGTNGTPDLRERFVRGAPNAVNPGGTGGAATHLHAFAGSVDNALGNHDHNFCGETDYPGSGSCDWNGQADSTQDYGCHTHEFNGCTDPVNLQHNHDYNDSTSSCSSLPPYYNIVFIMKVS